MVDHLFYEASPISGVNELKLSNSSWVQVISVLWLILMVQPLVFSARVKFKDRIFQNIIL